MTEPRAFWGDQSNKRGLEYHETQNHPTSIRASVLKYQLSDKNHLFLNAGWQDWSEFSNNQLEFSGGTVSTLDRQWDDTWHAGIAFAHLDQVDSGYSIGVSYDSSPIDEAYKRNTWMES